MGWCMIPGEDEALTLARQSCRHDDDRELRARQLVESWRDLAGEACQECGRPIGWNARYYLVEAREPQPGRPNDMVHGVCLEKKHEKSYD